MKEIWFDMDGTFVDFYNVKNWLKDIENENARPYKIAKPLVNPIIFTEILNELQKRNYKIGIISWLAKNSSIEYEEKVKSAKIGWLNKNLPLVNWDFIKIVPYGQYKEVACNYSHGILFDDEEPNRKYWSGTAYSTENIIEILKGLM